MISGSRNREPRVVVGGRAFVPWLTQRCDFLSLELRTIIVESKNSATVQGVMVTVTGVCQVKISGFKEVDDSNGNKTLEKDVHAILLAGQHFIGQNDQDIEHAVASTLEGHQRSILGTLTVEELSQDRASFSSKVRELANEDLRSMGMEIVSYTIASLTDDDGYLESLGVTQTAQVKKLALLGECTNKNEAKQHKAEQELRAQIKINQAQKEIEQSSRDVQVTQAKLREEINVANARADAAKLFEEAKLKQAIVEEEAKQQVVKASIEVDVETEKVRRRRMELEATVQAQAALAVQMIEAMPEVAKAIAAPLSKTDKIVFMGSGGDGSGPSAMISEVAKSAELVNETLQSMTGVSLGDMLKGDASLPGLGQVATPLTLSALASLPTK